MQAEQNPNSGAPTVTPQRYTCTKCGHSWYPRGPQRPDVCPKCKTRKWHQPRHPSDLPPRTRELLTLVQRFVELADPEFVKHVLKLMEAAIRVGQRERS